MSEVEQAAGQNRDEELRALITRVSGGLEKALELARKDLEGTEDIYAYDSLAWVYYKLGDTKNALTAMEKALRLGTEDAILYHHAAMIYNLAGETDKAKGFLELIFVTNPYYDIEEGEDLRGILSKLERGKEQ